MSLRNKYSSSTINDSGTSLVNYNNKQKKKIVIIIKPLKNIFALKIII